EERDAGHHRRKPERRLQEPAPVGGVVGEGVHHVCADERSVHFLEGGALRRLLSAHRLWRENLHPLSLSSTLRASRAWPVNASSRAVPPHRTAAARPRPEISCVPGHLPLQSAERPFWLTARNSTFGKDSGRNAGRGGGEEEDGTEAS